MSSWLQSHRDYQTFLFDWFHPLIKFLHKKHSFPHRGFNFQQDLLEFFNQNDRVVWFEIIVKDQSNSRESCESCFFSRLLLEFFDIFFSEFETLEISKNRHFGTHQKIWVSILWICPHILRDLKMLSFYNWRLSYRHLQWTINQMQWVNPIPNEIHVTFLYYFDCEFFGKS